jgi:ParB family transcriptional regulator, chromosome partitioning protein
MRRVYPTDAAISDKAQRKLDKLTREHDELVVEAEAAENEEAAQAITARLNQIEADIETLKGEPVYDAADIAAGGAFVSLGYEGGVRVERGFIRKEDEAPAVSDPADGAEVSEDEASREGSTALPERLVMQLTAQRTAALRNAVATRPNVAFVSVVHALAAATFYVGSAVLLSGFMAPVAGHATTRPFFVVS